MRKAKPNQRKERVDHTRRRFRLSSVGPVLLFLIVLAVYAPSVRNDFIYDDTQVILAQPAPRSLTDVTRIFGERHFPRLPYYRPITRTTLLLQKSLHGDNPAPFHLTNAALMGAAAVLAYLLLRLPAFSIPPALALLAAALFTLHPIASSCVYPVSSGRETLLPSIWTIAAVYAYLRKGTQWRVLAFVAFVFAIFSKEQSVIVPLLFLWADVLAISDEPPGSKVENWVKRYWPFVPVFLIYFLIRQRLFQGAEYAAGSLYGPILSGVYALQTLVAPFAELVYEPTVPIWLSLPRLAITGVVVVTLLVLVLRHRTSIGRRATFWLGWFILALLPTANLLRQEASFDERYVFLASLAFFVLLALLASVNWEQVRVRQSSVATGAILAGCCALISSQRCDYFKDDVAFSQQWLRSNPGIANPHYNLGYALKKQGKFESAIVRFYEQWLATDAASINAHYNLGFALAKQGKFDSAILHYSEALRLNPDYAYAHNNLGNALAAVGRLDEAVTHFSDALRIKPDYADAHHNLGLILARQGKLDEAIAHFEQTLRLKPDSSDAHENLDYAVVHSNLGNARAQQGRFEEAASHYSEALRIRPDYADAHNNLANALVEQEKFEEAVVHYAAALQINPDYEDAQHNLEGVLNQVPALRKKLNR